MKNPKHIYISGPMTGRKHLNFPAFQRVANQLRKGGYKVCSPAEMEGNSRQGMPWVHCLRRDIIAIMQRCNKMVILPGWFWSRGARLEVLLAWLLGFEIHYIKYYLTERNDWK